MQKLGLLLSVAVISTFSMNALASDEGFYAGAGLGLNIPQDSDVKSDADRTSVDWSNGLAMKGSFGYAFGNNIRAELEAARRHNDNNSADGVDGIGDNTLYSAMANVIYDFEMEKAFTPYLGIGMGYAWFDPDNVRPLAGAQGILSENSGAFAYQGLAGVSYKINDPLSATLEYRYFRTLDQKANTSAPVSVRTEYVSHDIMLGLRWNFGKYTRKAEAAPVVAAPIAEEPSSYIVFFDFDKDNITKSASEVINFAASDYKHKGSAVIKLEGHTDRAGSDEYNMNLSKRRAEAVASELAKMGISKQEISITAKGETVPLVGTPDGIKEPQNRRVEIVIE